MTNATTRASWRRIHVKPPMRRTRTGGSDDERRPADGGDDHGGAASGSAGGPPRRRATSRRRAGRGPDGVRRRSRRAASARWPTNPPWTPGVERRLALRRSRWRRNGRPRTTPSIATTIASDGLDPDRRCPGRRRRGGRRRTRRSRGRSRRTSCSPARARAAPARRRTRSRRSAREALRQVSSASLGPFRFDRQSASSIGRTSVARRVIDSSSYGDGKPAMRWR